MTRRAILPCAAVALLLVQPPVSAQTPRSPEPDETLVMPFENSQTDPKLYWLGEGSAVLLTELLERYGAAVVARDVREAAFDRLQLPPAPALSHATVIKVAHFVGAADVVVGAYELAGEHLTVRARYLELEAGRLLPEVIERGPLADLFGIYDRVARRLREATTPAPPAAEGTILRSPQAFELYVKGLVAEAPGTQRAYLEQAVKAAPADDRSKLALWQVYTDGGDYLRALDIVTSVPRTSLHARAARYLSALSQIELKRFDEALATLKQLQSEERSAEVLNAMGVVVLRKGATSQTGVATYYFSQASQTDPVDADYFFNLGYAYWLDKDPPAAIYWLREAVRRDPADGDAHFVLAAALHQTGAVAEAGRERELARRLSSRYESASARPPASEQVPRSLERVKEHLERPTARAAATIATTGQRDHAELAAFHLDAGRRAFLQERDREAEQELRRALYLSPYLAEGHVLLGRLHLRSGRAAEAVQAFKIALWSEDHAAGRVALAEAYLQMQNIAAAKEEVTRALALDPTSKEAMALRDKLATMVPPASDEVPCSVARAYSGDGDTC
jgi:tetratricopeptide (TPR) repeat protein